ncbi:MAG: hypothetical protein M3468_09975 [Acidobacteriota bacterium]|nr:hypothetical protein [Acidobacteriota bacterium]
MASSSSGGERLASSHPFRDGIRRVNGASALLAGLCVVTLLVALPLSLALRGMLEAHFGRSVIAQSAAAGANYEWWQEFLSQATGLGATFLPSIIGFGAVLENLSAFMDNAPMAATIAGVTAAWMLIWSFLSGGVLDRLARDRRTRTHGFFAACGVHFWRFLRLGVLAWVIYACLFGWVHGWIFDDAYPRWIADLTSERTAFLLRTAGYALFGSLLIFFSVIFDYARIRIIVEDRRSAVGALAAAARFVRRRFFKVLGLYLLNGLAFLLLLAVYAIGSPGAPGQGLAMWATLLLGQAYIVGRHYLKLLFYASQTALFQSQLAHAAYTAPPPVVWPDSPAAEAIVNADPLPVS